MRVILFIILIFLVSSCATCTWCKESCKRTEYVDKVVNIYRYPQIMQDELQSPEYQPMSKELDIKIRAIVDLLRKIEQDRGKCFNESTVCDRTSVSDELMAQLQTELVAINQLYFQQMTIGAQNINEAVTYYKRLLWKVQQYEEAIKRIIEEEKADTSSIKNN